VFIWKILANITQVSDVAPGPLVDVFMFVFFFKGNIEYYANEIEINGKFRTYAKNAAIVFAGHNTVTAQLKVKSDRGIYLFTPKCTCLIFREHANSVYKSSAFMNNVTLDVF
jgi:hypothetical protein